jgi:hypothetical protein
VAERRCMIQMHYFYELNSHALAIRSGDYHRAAGELQHSLGQ